MQKRSRAAAAKLSRAAAARGRNDGFISAILASAPSSRLLEFAAPAMSYSAMGRHLQALREGCHAVIRPSRRRAAPFASQADH